MSRRGRRPKKSDISKKIAILVREGKTPEQAAGAAYGMARQGKLTRGGGYRRAKRRKGARR
jgi:hypothetical protein